MDKSQLSPGTFYRLSTDGNTAIDRFAKILTDVIGFKYLCLRRSHHIKEVNHLFKPCLKVTKVSSITIKLDSSHAT